MDDDSLQTQARAAGVGPSRAPLIVGVAVGVLAIAGGVYWFVLRGPDAAPPTATSPSAPAGGAAALSPPAPIEAVPDAPAPPPADGDALLRRLAAGWGTGPELSIWLAAESIVQRLAAATVMVAKGASPRTMLSFVTVPGAFTVDEELSKKPSTTPGAGDDVSERDFIAPAAYARYDRLTAVVTGVDPAAAASAYVQLRPYLEGAFAQIAQPGERFEGVLRAAIDRVLAVPVPKDRVEVVPKGALYLYADPALEGLLPAEKQFLRFGPTNQENIKGWLRRFATSAGMAR